MLALCPRPSPRANCRRSSVVLGRHVYNTRTYLFDVAPANAEQNTAPAETPREDLSHLIVNPAEPPRVDDVKQRTMKKRWARAWRMQAAHEKNLRGRHDRFTATQADTMDAAAMLRSLYPTQPVRDLLGARCAALDALPRE